MPVFGAMVIDCSQQAAKVIAHMGRVLLASRDLFSRLAKINAQSVYRNGFARFLLAPRFLGNTADGG
jgi:hypothetical protein